MDHTKDGDLAMERQRVLGCQSIQASGAGVEWLALSTDAGDCKGGALLCPRSFGYFSWRNKKSTNIPMLEVIPFREVLSARAERI